MNFRVQPAKLLLIVMAASACVCGGIGYCSDESLEWRTVKKTHFLVHYVTNENFARAVGYEAEILYDRIRRDLGFAKADDFWLWDDRAKIYIYPSRQSFLSATGVPSWVLAKASYKDRALSTFEQGMGFLKSSLPHELTHLIFEDFVGPDSNPPLWLHEGLAEWEEENASDGTAHAKALRLLGQGRLLSLAQMGRVETGADLQDYPHAASFYAGAASLVGYLITEHGSSRFQRLCRQLKSGKTIEESLKFAYPTRIRNMEQLERAWHEFLQRMKESPDDRR